MGEVPISYKMETEINWIIIWGGIMAFLTIGLVIAGIEKYIKERRTH